MVTLMTAPTKLNFILIKSSRLQLHLALFYNNFLYVYLYHSIGVHETIYNNNIIILKQASISVNCKDTNLTKLSWTSLKAICVFVAYCQGRDNDIVIFLFVNSYIIESGVCFLTLTDKTFSKRAAFSFLEELSSEFHREFGHKIATATRPYSFIEFGEHLPDTVL